LRARSEEGFVRSDAYACAVETNRPEIYLPRVEWLVQTTIQDLASPDLPNGTETILLVEDDATFRQLARHC
jgi:hypothetical protein